MNRSFLYMMLKGAIATAPTVKAMKAGTPLHCTISTGSPPVILMKALHPSTVQANPSPAKAYNGGYNLLGCTKGAAARGKWLVAEATPRWSSKRMSRTSEVSMPRKDRRCKLVANPTKVAKERKRTRKGRGKREPNSVLVPIASRSILLVNATG